MFRSKIRNRSFDWMGEKFAPMIDSDHFLGHSSFRFPWRNVPPVNLKKNGHFFEMEVAVPGFSKEELQVLVQDDVLIVKGKKLNRKGKVVPKVIVEEFGTNSFERKFKLTEGIGKEKIDAHYENGVLNLRFTDVPAEEEINRKEVVVM